MKATTQKFFSRYYSQHLLLTLVAVAAALLFISMLSPFLEAICLAAIFSLGIYTLIEKLRRRVLGKTDSPPLPLLLGSFAILFSIIGTLFAVTLLSFYNTFLGENKEATRQTLQQITIYGTEKLNAMRPYFDQWLRIFGLKDNSFSSTLSSLPSTVFGAAGAFVANIPQFVIQSIVFATMMLFFFFSHKTLYRFALRFKTFASEDVNRLTQILKRSSYESIMTNAIVGVLQATIVTIGAAFVGFSEWSPIFSVTFIFAFIPVIGGSSFAFLLALLALVTNNIPGGITMFGVGCVTGISDNVLRSYLMAQSEKQTSSLLCFVSIIGAVYVFGFSGLFIGPFVINMCMQLIPLVLPKNSSHRAIDQETSSLA